MAYLARINVGFACSYLVAWLKTMTGDYKRAFPILAFAVLLVFLAAKTE